MAYAVAGGAWIVIAAYDMTTLDAIAIDHSLVYETVYCSMKHVFLANTSSTHAVVSLSSPNIKYFQSLNFVTTPKLKKKNKS